MALGPRSSLAEVPAEGRAAGCSVKPDIAAIRSSMLTFLRDPSIANADALRLAIEVLARGERADAWFFADLASDLANYRPDGGELLFARREMLLPRVHAALCCLGR